MPWGYTLICVTWARWQAGSDIHKTDLSDGAMGNMGSRSVVRWQGEVVVIGSMVSKTETFSSRAKERSREARPLLKSGCSAERRDPKEAVRMSNRRRLVVVLKRTLCNGNTACSRARVVDWEQLHACLRARVSQKADSKEALLRIHGVCIDP